LIYLQRQEASGAANANGSPQRAELDRLIRETQQMSNELAELREKIHMSVEGQRANKGSESIFIYRLLKQRSLQFSVSCR
jgi:hypothetical protein